MVAYLSSHAHPRTFALSLSLTAHALGHRCRRRGCLMHTLWCVCLISQAGLRRSAGGESAGAGAARRRDQRFVCWSLETARPRAADPRLHRSPMRRGAVTTRYRPICRGWAPRRVFGQGASSPSVTDNLSKHKKAIRMLVASGIGWPGHRLSVNFGRVTSTFALSIVFAKVSLPSSRFLYV